MAPGPPSGVKLVADVPNDMQLSKSVIHEARIEAGETVAGIILERVAGNDAIRCKRSMAVTGIRLADCCWTFVCSVDWVRRMRHWFMAFGRNGA